MPDRDDQANQHALLIVEEDTADDPELYQVTKVDHGQDTKQFHAVREAHRQLRSEATDETGIRHRLVVEWYEDEDLADHFYEGHRRKLEAHHGN